MALIGVRPGELASASGQQLEVADRIRQLASRAEMAASQAAAGCGEAVAAQAVQDAGSSWRQSLELIANSVGGQGTNVGVSGQAYTATDSSVMPAPGGAFGR